MIWKSGCFPTLSSFAAFALIYGNYAGVLAFQATLGLSLVVPLYAIL